jgi:topoisomerase IA-like protein
MVAGVRTFSKAKTNYKLPKGVNAAELTYNDCLKIIADAGEKGKSGEKGNKSGKK